MLLSATILTVLNQPEKALPLAQEAYKLFTTRGIQEWSEMAESALESAQKRLKEKKS